MQGDGCLAFFDAHKEETPCHDAPVARWHGKMEQTNAARRHC
jgi:hypothetical protein